MHAFGLVFATEPDAGTFQGLFHGHDAGGHHPVATVLVGRHGPATDAAMPRKLLLTPVEEGSSRPDLGGRWSVLLFAQDAVPNRPDDNRNLTELAVVAQNVHRALTSAANSYSD